MEKIEKVWFDQNRIFILTSGGSEKSRPLEAFPLLMDASDEQRSRFDVWADGQSIRWDDIDEDIHISSFDEELEPNPDNEVAKMLDLVGVTDIAAFAQKIGMRKAKLDLFRYGIWTPSEETIQKIKDCLHHFESRTTAEL